MYDLPTLFGECDAAASLRDRLRLFRECSAVVRDRMLCQAIRNDGRFLGSRGPTSNSRRLLEFAQDAAVRLSASDWPERLAEVTEVLQVAGLSPLEQGYVRSKAMALSGQCPLLHFAFGAWRAPPVEANHPETYVRLAELSTTYLLRLARFPGRREWPGLVGAGAYSRVYRDDSDIRNVRKIPRNLAALRFANRIEARVLTAVKSTLLTQYVPRIASFDEESGIVTREFIDGLSGDNLLEGDRIRARHLAALKEFYECAIEACNVLRIVLDIHPANILWVAERSRWILVDLGTAPQIGADYYPMQSFDEYYDKIWLRRAYLKRTIPIRSVDLAESPLALSACAP